MAQIKDFLNAKSMITPGIAGAITMMISNTLFQQFELPPKWVALVLSFLLGLLVFGDTSTPVWQRALFYLVNSLIIFAMAVGTNVTGQAIVSPSGAHFSPESEVGASPFFSDWL